MCNSITIAETTPFLLDYIRTDRAYPIRLQQTILKKIEKNPIFRFVFWFGNGLYSGREFIPKTSNTEVSNTSNTASKTGNMIYTYSRSVIQVISNTCL